MPFNWLLELAKMEARLFAAEHPVEKSWKKKLPKMSAIEPGRWYGAKEVAALLNVSYDHALRLIPRIPGAKNFGKATVRFKQGRKIWRISGRDLQHYLDSDL